MSVSNAYPNPVSRGGVVKVNLLTSCPLTTDWAVYTLGYKMIYRETTSVNGPKTVVWTLQDDKGVGVAAGLYYMKFNTGSNPIVLKVLVLN
jgi:hypothetical protein